MTVNIRSGDLLVVNGNEYPVVACAQWRTSRMSLAAFRRMTTETATVKRAVNSGSKRSAPATISGLSLQCTPLDPYTAEQSSGKQDISGLDTPFVGLQTFATANGIDFVHLALEELKR